jgi:hypothetical protein
VQPKPTEGHGPDIVDLVKKNLDERRKKGIETYGVPLRAGNGRDMLIDAYEEALDLACYLRAEIENRRMAESDGQGDGFWAK